jgi:hypothetical protein
MRLIVQPGRASTLNGFNEIPLLLDIASQTILQSESDLSSQLNVALQMRSRDLPEARPAGAQPNPNATIYDGALEISPSGHEYRESRNLFRRVEVNATDLQD